MTSCNKHGQSEPNLLTCSFIYSSLCIKQEGTSHKRTSCAQKLHAPAVQTCLLEAANEKRVGLKGEDELSLSFTALQQ